MFDAATAGDLSDVCSAVEKFEKDNAELYGKCLEFGKILLICLFVKLKYFENQIWRKRKFSFLIQTLLIPLVFMP